MDPSNLTLRLQVETDQEFWLAFEEENRSIMFKEKEWEETESIDLGSSEDQRNAHFSTHQKKSVHRERWNSHVLLNEDMLVGKDLRRAAEDAMQK